MHPGRPGRVARVPQALEGPDVTQRVHALPEAFVSIGRELSIRGQALERLDLEVAAVAAQGGEPPGLEHQKAAVDPALADLRLVFELADQVAVEAQVAESGGGTHRSDRSDAA